MAEQIGLHPDDEDYDDFFFIAETACVAPLPTRWQKIDDAASGQAYYYSQDNPEGSQTWDHPFKDYLTYVVTVGRHIRENPTNMDDVIARIKVWLKEQLDVWHGPFPHDDDSGEQHCYYVNSETQESTWFDPRVDTQFIFELMVGFLLLMEQRGMVKPAPSDEENGSDDEDDDSDDDKPFTFTEQELELAGGGRDTAKTVYNNHAHTDSDISSEDSDTSAEKEMSELEKELKDLKRQEEKEKYEQAEKEKEELRKKLEEMELAQKEMQKRVEEIAIKKAGEIVDEKLKAERTADEERRAKEDAEKAAKAEKKKRGRSRTPPPPPPGAPPVKNAAVAPDGAAARPTAYNPSDESGTDGCENTGSVNETGTMSMDSPLASTAKSKDVANAAAANAAASKYAVPEQEEPEEPRRKHEEPKDESFWPENQHLKRAEPAAPTPPNEKSSSMGSDGRSQIPGAVPVAAAPDSPTSPMSPLPNPDANNNIKESPDKPITSSADTAPPAPPSTDVLNAEPSANSDQDKLDKQDTVEFQKKTEDALANLMKQVENIEVSPTTPQVVVHEVGNLILVKVQ